MKRLIVLAFLLAYGSARSQTDSSAKKPVEIFSSIRAINAQTTEVIQKGKMEFNVFHYMGDMGGTFGGIKNFFGLDNTTDVRIGFTVGIAKGFDLTLARCKGASFHEQEKLIELGAKYQLMRQMENDPSHPVAISLYGNMVIASDKSSSDTVSVIPAQERDDVYLDFSDRISNVLQLIIARRFKNFSIQLNPALLTRGRAKTFDKSTMFALGGAIRFAVSHRVNIVVDYFHPFRSETVKKDFKKYQGIKFYDPLGFGVEILTSGHIFRLNFTNTTDIQENRFIPRTQANWGDGQFRWAFTIARKFTLWRDKK